MKVPPRPFDSVPYLVTVVFPGLWDLTLYPEDVSESNLIQLARQQTGANRLSACLVLSEARGLYFDANGQEERRSSIPRGGVVLLGRMKPPQDFAGSPNYVERQERFKEFSRRNPSPGGFLVGRPVHCVRKPTKQDRHVGNLQGRGIPDSLTTCSVCGDLKGNCFYPDSVAYRGLIWHLTCRCDNDNLCAGCLQPLEEHKLDTCYYDRKAKRIFHVAGYLALRHHCG